MKMPKELEYSLAALIWADAEAIVRDCAKAILLENTESRHVDYEQREQLANILIARYGLEP